MFFGTSSTERMRILAGGNVGIGTNAPTARLSVSGSGNFNAAGAARFDLFNTTANVGFFQHVFNDGRWQLGTGSSTRLLVDTAGNLGIGTGPAPAHKLDVAGAINTSTQYHIGGQRVLSVPANFNTFAGVGAGDVTTGAGNSFFGRNSGNSNVGGVNNSFFGFNAGAANTAGSRNTFVGEAAGVSNTTGSQNTIIGALAGMGFTNLTNATAIGHRAFVEQSNSLVLGSINGTNGATADSRIGIGTTSPTSKLMVAGAGSFNATGAARFDLFNTT